MPVLAVAFSKVKHFQPLCRSYGNYCDVLRDDRYELWRLRPSSYVFAVPQKMAAESERGNRTIQKSPIPNGYGLAELAQAVTADVPVHPLPPYPGEALAPQRSFALG
jgi:hypothetical protein